MFCHRLCICLNTDNFENDFFYNVDFYKTVAQFGQCFGKSGPFHICLHLYLSFQQWSTVTCWRFLNPSWWARDWKPKIGALLCHGAQQSGSGLDGSASGPSKPRATVGLTALRRRSGATEAAHQSHPSDKIQKTFTFSKIFWKNMGLIFLVTGLSKIYHKLWSSQCVIIFGVCKSFCNIKVLS